VQVHHFACHCDTTAELDDDYLIRLSTSRGRRRDISFGELQTGYLGRALGDADPGAARDGQSRPRAVVLLNACGSSRTNPLTSFSFPRWFINWGHRAFIGTETTVPDAVASRFAASFYSRLLERRRPLGEALVWARRDLLRDFRNPLGLLYVVYGDTDLVVAQARPGISGGSVPQAQQDLVQHGDKEDR
jgi:CHAT domain-containing protein